MSVCVVGGGEGAGDWYLQAKYNPEGIPSRHFTQRKRLSVHLAGYFFRSTITGEFTPTLP